MKRKSTAGLGEPVQGPEPEEVMSRTGHSKEAALTSIRLERQARVSESDCKGL